MSDLEQALADANAASSAPAAPVETPPAAPAPNDAPAQPATEQAPAPAGNEGQQQQAAPPAIPPADAPPAADLYDLPDGRKVDGATLAREWKDNFLPDYTRKSQILSDMARVEGTAQQQPTQQQQQPNINNSPQNPPPGWQDPNWIPPTYGELVKLSKQEAVQEVMQTLAQQQQQQAADRQAADKYVDTQLAEIRKVDPNLNPDLLFAHASKYGFNNLQAAHANMRDMRTAVKTTEQRVQQNIQNRQNEPVSVKTSDAPSKGVHASWQAVNQGNQSPQEYLESLQGK